MQFQHLLLFTLLVSFCGSTFAVLERVQTVINNINGDIETLYGAVQDGHRAPVDRSGSKDAYISSASPKAGDDSIHDALIQLATTFKDGYAVVDALRDGSISAEAAASISSQLESKKEVFASLTTTLVNDESRYYNWLDRKFRTSFGNDATQLNSEISVFYRSLEKKVTEKNDSKTRVKNLGAFFVAQTTKIINTYLVLCSGGSTRC